MTESLASAAVVDDSRSRFFAAADPDAQAAGPAFQLGSVRLAGVVMPASGCFGPELGRLIPVRELGAAVTKTVFAERRGGNPVHRITEIAAGMVNSVGIPSRGASGYLAAQHPPYLALGIPTIISVGGHRPDDYAPLVADLGGAGVAYELNVSCPNLERAGTAIGADPHTLARVVAAVRAVTDRPLVVKLPSMLSSVEDCARAAEDAGADALCVANSLPALPLHPQTGSPELGNLIGGLSGPSIRPVVLRLVWLASRAVAIPVIGCGGIASTADALEYFSVGAAAVQVGTANFADPAVMVRIARELAALCRLQGVDSVCDLRVAAR